MDWNFQAWKYPLKFIIEITLKDPIVFYEPGLPNDLVVKHILPRLLEECKPLESNTLSAIGIMWDLQLIHHEWRWLVSSTTCYATFEVIICAAGGGLVKK
jgi:hypothetical protein